MATANRIRGCGRRYMSGFQPASNLMRMAKTKALGPVIEIGPERDEATAMIVFLHGLGDTGAGWVQGVSMIQRVLPHCRFMLPTAPVQPVSINMGHEMNSWYDIVGLSTRDAELCNGIEESRSKVTELLIEEFNQGVKPERTILAGFSQGGALSLYTGLQLDVSAELGLESPTGVAGVLCMSGYLPCPSAFTPSAAGLKTPTLLLHGLADEMVEHKLAIATHDALHQHNIDIRLKSYPGLEHGACAEELQDAADWISAVVPSEL